MLSSELVRKQEPSGDLHKISKTKSKTQRKMQKQQKKAIKIEESSKGELKMNHLADLRKLLEFDGERNWR